MRMQATKDSRCKATTSEDGHCPFPHRRHDIPGRDELDTGCHCELSAAQSMGPLPAHFTNVHSHKNLAPLK